MSTLGKKEYPKALPFRAPDDLAEQCECWRRRTYWVLSAGAGLLALAAVAALLAYNEARAARAPATRAEEAPMPTPGVMPPIAKLGPESAPATLAITAKAPSSVAAAERPVADKDTFLEVLGSLSAAHLYQSHLNIGLLADGVESEAYTAKEADDTLQSIGAMLDQVDGQLNKLKKLDLNADDRAALEQIKTVDALLRLEAKSLQSYWKSADREQAKQFHETRKAAWQGLSKIMQLDAK